MEAPGGFCFLPEMQVQVQLYTLGCGVLQAVQVDKVVQVVVQAVCHIVRLQYKQIGSLKVEE